MEITSERRRPKLKWNVVVKKSAIYLISTDHIAFHRVELLWFGLVIMSVLVTDQCCVQSMSAEVQSTREG